MVKKIFALCVVVLLIFACDDAPTNVHFTQAPISEDYSDITDPQERWAAYGFTDYALDQTWGCECLPPYSCTAYIVQSDLHSVEYDLSAEQHSDRSDADIESYVHDKAMTVEVAFALIDVYTSAAYRVDVEYSERFGFPTSLYIDIDSMTVDEEIIRSFSNLRRIRN